MTARGPGQPGPYIIKYLRRGASAGRCFLLYALRNLYGGRFRRLRAASDFANSGKVTKAPFRNLRFLKISLRKPLVLACVFHPARGCKSKNGYFLRPLPLVV